MTYHCWYWPWSPGSGFSGFLHWKFIGLSPFLYCAHWKEVTMHSTCFSNGERCSTSLKMEYLHKLFGIFLRGRLVSSSFLNLFNCFIQSLCFGLYTNVFFYLFCFSNCYSSAISFFSWHLCSFVTLLSLCFCFWVLSYFCTTRYIRLILCITCQSPRISHLSKSWLTFLPLFPLIVSSFNLCIIYFFWLFF